MRNNIIATSDWHIRFDVPRCRLETEEEWEVFCSQVINSIFETAYKEDADICIAGDIFHRATSSIKLVNFLLKHFLGFENDIYIMPGQHDLPMHSHTLTYNSAYGILMQIAKQRQSRLHLLEYEHAIVPFGKEEVEGNTKSDILFMHQFVVEKEKDIPYNSGAIIAFELLKRYPDYKTIVVGDNHNGFHYTYKERNVIVPGCLTIQASDLKEYDPSIYLITDGKIKKQKIYNEKENISDDYIVSEREINERISSFVDVLKNEESFSISFEENVERALNNPEIDKHIKDEILYFMSEAEK